VGKAPAPRPVEHHGTSLRSGHAGCAGARHSATPAIRFSPYFVQLGSMRGRIASSESRTVVAAKT
jgi:hypothetical protein